MNAPRLWIAAALGLAAQLLMTWAAWPAPAALRVALAFALLVLWPGAAVLSLMGERPPGARGSRPDGRSPSASRGTRCS